MSEFCAPPSNGVPLISGCCNDGQCLIYLATVLSGVRQNGFTSTTAGIGVTQTDCRMWRTKRTALYYTSDGTKAWEEIDTYSYPGNERSTQILFDDGNVRPIGQLPPGFAYNSIVSYTDKTVRVELSNGIVQSYQMEFEVSDQFTTEQIFAALGGLVPDDAWMQTLPMDGVNYFRRTYASDGSIDVQQVDGGRWATMEVLDEWQGMFPNAAFEIPWNTIAQRFQILQGEFPRPTDPVRQVWDGNFFDYYAADMRSRVLMTSGRGCFGRIIINNGSTPTCWIDPVPDPITRYAVATPQIDVIFTTPNANETVAIQCGECPI